MELLFADDPLLSVVEAVRAVSPQAAFGEIDRVVVCQTGLPPVGVDEAGRGTLAGPLCAAAVIPPVGWVDNPPAALTDSKLMTAAARDEWFVRIVADCQVAVVAVEPVTIDRVGIVAANHQAMTAAVDQVAGRAAGGLVLYDGFRPDGAADASVAVVKGDRRSVAVAAASVVAKVTHDRLLCAAAAAHPGYGFDVNVGYGTADHLAALRRLGPSPLHRRTFAPVATLTD